MKSPPTIIDRIPRKARAVVDLVLALALLLACYYASGWPVFGEEARFRRAEKDAMVGPSMLLDRLNIRSDWPDTGYHVLRIGDDGDEIMFYSIRIMQTSAGGAFLSDDLLCREKTDGVLLTTLPTRYRPPFSEWSLNSVPLLLFVDDPAAVRAVITITLSDGKELAMSQVRGEGSAALFGEDAWIAGCVRERFFLYGHPLASGEWDSDWSKLMETNAGYSASSQEWPAVIALYDRENQLIRTVDYTIRSRAGDAHA